METGEIFPCLFCLMQHRKKSNYDELYKEVANMIDKESGLSESCTLEGKCLWIWSLPTRILSKECLNDPLVCVCYFHLCGVTNKTVVDIGLKKLVFSSLQPPL
jgi:hypothetical protein